MKQVTGSQTLRDRIEAVYLAFNDQPEARGALTWFAWKAKVIPGTVSRWVTGQSPISGPALALLEELERSIRHERSKR